MNRLLIKKQAKASLKGKWGKAIGFNIVVSILMFIIPAAVTAIAVLFADASKVANKGSYSIDDFFAALFTGTSLILFIVAFVLSVVIIPLFAYATAKVFLKIKRGEDFTMGSAFDGFRDNPGKVFCTGALAYIIIYLAYYIPASIAGAIVGHVAPRARSVIDALWTMDHGRVKYLVENLGAQLFVASCLFVLAVFIGIIVQYVYTMIYYVRADDPEIGVVAALKKSRKIMHGHKLEYFGLQISFIGWIVVCCVTCGIGFLWLIPYNLTANAAFFDEAKDNIIE